VNMGKACCCESDDRREISRLLCEGAELFVVEARVGGRRITKQELRKSRNIRPN